jgi:7,8-dihydropterin-6-yl-methyl-4-(beta-D-ribofuranosyl)aminobenzene 5'-phosphate synthase
MPDILPVDQLEVLVLLDNGHCTGWRAMSALARVFGDELVPSAVGRRYTV